MRSRTTVSQVYRTVAIVVNTISAQVVLISDPDYLGAVSGKSNPGSGNDQPLRTINKNLQARLNKSALYYRVRKGHSRIDNSDRSPLLVGWSVRLQQLLRERKWWYSIFFFGLCSDYLRISSSTKKSIQDD